MLKSSARIGFSGAGGNTTDRCFTGRASEEANMVRTFVKLGAGDGASPAAANFASLRGDAECPGAFRVGGSPDLSRLPVRRKEAEIRQFQTARGVASACGCDPSVRGLHAGSLGNYVEACRYKANALRPSSASQLRANR